MKGPFGFTVDRASREQIAGHLEACDADFVPRLSRRVDLNEYAGKIFDHAVRFEAWSETMLVGLVAAYCNDPLGRAHITSVSVLKPWWGKGIADSLLLRCIRHAAEAGFRAIDLEVGMENRSAIALYQRHGFSIVNRQASASSLEMSLDLDRRSTHAE